MCILRALYINCRVGKLKCEIHSRNLATNNDLKKILAKCIYKLIQLYICVCTLDNLELLLVAGGESTESDPTSSS